MGLHEVEYQRETCAKIFDDKKKTKIHKEYVLDKTLETYKVCTIEFGSSYLEIHVQDRHSDAMYTC